MKSKEITILQTPNKALKTVCQTLSLAEIKSIQIQKVLKEMSQALAESGDGVAIAAPQIGHTVRIFMIAGSILDHVNNYHGEHISPDKVFINPIIIKASKAKKPMRGEGCLSVRYIYGTTKRSDKVTVKALDENGNEFMMAGSGLLAQIFQHEIDHLDGILFIDHAHDIREMGDEEKHDYQIELNRMRAERMN
jgi:peptide deformylase